jgi:L-serine dehydratase
MHASLFDLFKIGIGPSSSHTVGPMRAAYRFVERLSNHELLEKVVKVRVELFGSLALTGLGHGTDRGILLGLMGRRPDEIDPAEIQGLLEGSRKSGLLTLFGRHPVSFAPEDLVFEKQILLPGHSNGMRFTATGVDSGTLATRVYYPVGGGFITEEAGSLPRPPRTPFSTPSRVPTNFCASENTKACRFTSSCSQTRWPGGRSKKSAMG